MVGDSSSTASTETGVNSLADGAVSGFIGAGATSAITAAARRAAAGVTDAATPTAGTSFSQATNHATCRARPATRAVTEGNHHGEAHSRRAGRSAHGNAPEGDRCFRRTTSPRWTVVTNARADVGVGGIVSLESHVKRNNRKQMMGQGGLSRRMHSLSGLLVERDVSFPLRNRSHFAASRVARGHDDGPEI